jgi:curved DNA-binding protein CbpA
MSNPYKILQVDSEAEFEVIEAAYRRLARKYHPDVSDTPEARERMVAINRAWDELRTPERREVVDRARARAAAAESAGATRPTPQQGSTTPRRTPAGPGPSVPPASAPGDGSLRAAAQPRPGEDLHRVHRQAGDTARGPFSERDVWAGPPPGSPSGSVLGFGRYRGWSLGEVARRDVAYLEWLERSPAGRPFRLELDVLFRARGDRG